MKKIVLILTILLGSIILKAQTDPLQTFIIVGENESVNNTIPHCPYITQLTGEGTWYPNYTATTHPSYPNYMIMWCATNAGITNDLNPGPNSKQIDNIWTALNKVGKTTEGYFEDLRNQGSLDWTYNWYAAKHNGFYALGNVPDSVMKPFSMFPTDFSKCANVTWIVPNLCNDGHGVGTCPQNVLTFDNWLKNTQRIQQLVTYVKTHNAILIITFDEGGSSSNKIAFVMIGKNVNVGKTITTTYNHYNLNTTLLAWNGVAPINQGIGMPIINGWKKDSIIQPTDTTKKCYTYSTHTVTTIKIDTIKTVIKDSTLTACDTIINPPTTDTTVKRFMYMVHANTKIGVSSKETIAINYAKQIKANGYASYNINQISAINFNNARIKFNNNGILLGAVYGSLNELNYIDVQGLKPQFLISENEVWNKGSTISVVLEDSVLRVTAKKLADKLGIPLYGAYIGWLLGTTVNQFASELINYDSFIDVHCYRPSSVGLDSDYVQTRLDLLLPIAKQKNIKGIRFGTIESFELAFFGGGWTNTHTLDEIHPYFKKLFKRYEPYFIYDQDIFFTDDHLMAVIPYKAPSSNLFRSIFPVQYVDKTTQQTTLPSHIKMAEMPNQE